MATVQEVRAAVGAASQTVQQAIGSLQSANSQLGEAATALQTAIQSSSRPEAEQALQMLRQAMERITEGTQAAGGAIQNAQQFSASI